jgi:hypothetical protein
MEGNLMIEQMIVFTKTKCVYCRQQNNQWPAIPIDWWPDKEQDGYIHVKCAYRLLFNLSQIMGGLVLALAEEKVDRDEHG